MDELIELISLADAEEMARLIPVLRNGGTVKVDIHIEAEGGKVTKVQIGDTWSMGRRVGKG